MTSAKKRAPENLRFIRLSRTLEQSKLPAFFPICRIKGSKNLSWRYRIRGQQHFRISGKGAFCLPGESILSGAQDKFFIQYITKIEYMAVYLCFLESMKLVVVGTLAQIIHFHPAIFPGGKPGRQIQKRRHGS